MTNEDFAKAVLSLAREMATPDDMPVMVGTLTKANGVTGFERAEIGHPVFEFKGRYILYLKSLSPLQTKEGLKDFTIMLPFNKETLAPQIFFTQSKN